jgi:HNH endonuclease
MYRNKRAYYREQKAKGLHAHHIIPIHAGGSNDTSNIVFLTVEEHAEAHRKLYEDHGRWQDKVAWQCLSGQIGKEEAIKIAQKHSSKAWMKTPEAKEFMNQARQKAREAGNRPEPWNKGLTKEQDKRLLESSERAKLHMKEGRIHCIGDHHRGKNFSDLHKKNLSTAAKNRYKVTCEHCNKEVTPQMYTRWHGDNCKSRRG